MTGSHDETVEVFAQLFPPNPFKQGRVTGRDPQTGRKRVKTQEGAPVTRQALASHLGARGRVAGQALGYLPGDQHGTCVGAIDLDGKDFPSEQLDEARCGVLAVCAALGLHAYTERSSSGNGWHVWVWSEAMLPYGTMRDALRAITRRAGLPNVETYPMGDDARGRWIIMPYWGALKGDRPYLGKTFLEHADGQAIPVDELAEWIRLNPVGRLHVLASEEVDRARGAAASPAVMTDRHGGDLPPEAVSLLLAAAETHAPASRHDALAAFLNLGLRAGDLTAMINGLKGAKVFQKWCADGSRTPQGWADEIERWAVRVAGDEDEPRRGIPYLREAGFDIPLLPPVPEVDLPLQWAPRRDLPPKLPPVPTMPEEMLPGALRGWLADAAKLACLPLELFAVLAVAALSGLLGRSVRIRPEELQPWTVVPNLWGLIVGRPGAMKSMVLNTAVEPLQLLESRAAAEYDARLLDMEVEREALQAEANSLKRQVKPGTFDRERLRALKERERENVAVAKRYVTQNVTYEKLGELLRENPRGITLTRDELGSWLNDLTREERAEAQGFFLTAWNAEGAYSFERIGRGTVRADNPCVSVIGGLQPGPLSSYMAQSRAGSAGDSGLLQRFQLLVWPDSPGTWIRASRAPSAEARARAFGVFETLDTLYRPREEGPPTLSFSIHAQALWNDWRDALENRLRGGELEAAPSFESHLSKYRSLVPSLALIFHLVEVATPHADPATLPPVSAEALKLALNWADFLEQHARKVYALELRLSNAPAYALAEKIKTKAVRDGDRLRDLRRKDWTGLTDGLLNRAVEQLAELGWVQVQEIETGGRAAEVLRLHPDLRGGEG